MPQLCILCLLSCSCFCSCSHSCSCRYPLPSSLAVVVHVFVRAPSFLILSLPVPVEVCFACPLNCSCLQMRIGITWSVGDVPRSSEGETWRTLTIVVNPTTFIGSLSLFPHLCSCLCSDSIICPNYLVLLVCLVLYLLASHSFRFIVLFYRRSRCCVVVLSILSSDEH